MKTIGEINKKELDIEWSIKEFSSLAVEVGICYESPKFAFANAYWCFNIYPNGTKEGETEGYISLYFRRESTGPPISMEYYLGMKMSNKKIDPEYHVSCVYNEIEGYGRRRCLSRTELFGRKSELLPSDTLTLVCRIKHPKLTECESSANTEAVQCSCCYKNLDAHEDIQSHLRKCEDLPIKCRKCDDDVKLKNWYDHKCQMTEAEGSTLTKNCSHCKEIVNAENLSSHEKKCVDRPIKCPECSDVIALKNWYEHECKPARVGADQITETSGNDPVNKILQDFKQLFLKRENCDVVLRVKGKEFSAHKAILTARSPVFASTFQHNMKEKATGIVDIDDCDPSVFSDFLCFLYCREMDNFSEENVYSLYFVSDKYDVPDLKIKCIDFIKANLSIETFCDALRLALQFSEIDLTQFTTDFFIENAEKIITTIDWQTIVKEYPIQSNELFVKFVASLK